MLTSVDDVDIKHLSKVYDPKNRDSFVSLYLDLDLEDKSKFIEQRSDACRSILKQERDLLKNFEKTMQLVEKYIDAEREKGQRSLIVFASHSRGFFEAYNISVAVESLLILDTSPYIRPIARLRDEYETAGLIILDSHRAKIYIISSGRVEHEKEMTKDIMNRHKKGGWSQGRFQRLRKGAINDFFREVSEDAKELFIRGEVEKIVIAGPGNAKLEFKDFLPKEIRERVIDLVDVDFDESEHRLVHETVNIVSEDERKISDENVIRFKEEILKGGLAVYGLKETVNATRGGQVELLLVSKGYKVKGWICEKCQAVERGVEKTCPYCGSPLSEVDIIEEIIEFAERTDVEIEFVENPILDELGGVGGLLEYG